MLSVTYQSGNNIETIDVRAIHINAFPNPACDFVNVNADKPYRNVTISVYSMDGKLVKSERFNEESQTFCIPASDIPSGIYLIELIAESTAGRAEFIRSD